MTPAPQTQGRRPISPSLYALGAVLLWSTVATAFKISLRYQEPPQLLLVSSIVSILVLAAAAAGQGKLGMLLRCSRGDLLRAAALGMLNPFLYYLVLFEAYRRLPAQVAQPLNYTWALTLGLLSVPLLGQRLRPGVFIAGVVCHVGVFVISTHGDPTAFHFADPFGVALALGSTVIWALYWIGNTRSSLDPVLGLLLNFLFGLPLVAVACVLLSGPPVLSVEALASAAYVGVFEMGIAFILWLKALKLADSAASVGNFIFISPVLSLLLIHFVLGEPIVVSTWIGLPLIVMGLLIQGTSKRG